MKKFVINENSYLLLQYEQIMQEENWSILEQNLFKWVEENKKGTRKQKKALRRL